MIFKDLYFIRYNQLTWNLEKNGHQNQIRPEFLTRKRNVKQKSKKKTKKKKLMEIGNPGWCEWREAYI